MLQSWQERRREERNLALSHAAMGVPPLEFKEGVNRQTLKLDGSETIDIIGLEDSLKPGADIKIIVQRHDKSQTDVTLRCRIDTENELEYYRHGGILQFVLRNMLQ